MRKSAIFLSVLFLGGVGPVLADEPVKTPISYGDYRSITLASKAWGALERNDAEAALNYANKCIACMVRRRLRCRLH